MDGTGRVRCGRAWQTRSGVVWWGLVGMGLADVDGIGPGWRVRSGEADMDRTGRARCGRMRQIRPGWVVSGVVGSREARTGMADVERLGLVRRRGARSGGCGLERPGAGWSGQVR